MPKQHHILLATDGSPSAQAALATAAKFPWPRSSRAQAVVARLGWLPAVSEEARAAAEAGFEGIADTARGVFARRWPEAKIVFIDEPPGDAILAAATRFKASLIVLGCAGTARFAACWPAAFRGASPRMHSVPCWWCASPRRRCAVLWSDSMAARTRGVPFTGSPMVPVASSPEG